MQFLTKEVKQPRVMQGSHFAEAHILYQFKFHALRKLDITMVWQCISVAIIFQIGIISKF